MLSTWPWLSPMRASMRSSHGSCTSLRNSTPKRKAKMAVRQKPKKKPVPTRRGETVRCIFESLALRYRQVMENLRALSPHAVNTLHVIGGGSRNQQLNQYTANALQMPVVAGPAEATAIGNVMMQAIAAGMAANVAEMRRVLAAGTALQRYLPRDAERWNEAYMRYTERTRQTN